MRQQNTGHESNREPQIGGQFDDSPNGVPQRRKWSTLRGRKRASTAAVCPFSVQPG